MATELFNANRATTTVSSGGTDAPSGGTQETLTVASSAMFGAAATGVSQFHVADPAAPSEMIAVTNVSGTTWTVTRGAESTTPVAHAPGFTVYQVTTTGFLGSALVQAQLQAASGVAGLDSAQRIITPVGASYQNAWPSGGGFLVPSPAPVSRRPAWRAASWQQLFQTGHGWNANGAGVGSSNLNDTSTFIKGTQCATIVSAGNGSVANFTSPTFSAVNMTGMALRLTFQVPSVTNLNNMLFFLGTSSFTNYFVFTVTTHSSTAQNIVQSGEWVSLTISWADVQSAHGSFSVTAGAPSTTTGFTCMQLQFTDNAAGTATVHLQGIEIIPDTYNTFPGGVCSVVFDDSYEDVWTYARPVMDSNGYRGTTYNIAQNIGAGGSLTVAQLQQLQDFSGWEIAGHAYTQTAHNAGYDTLTALQVEDEMRYLRAWMLNNGFPLDNFAYPLGKFSATTDNVPIDQICSQYFATGRSIVSETTETFAPGMPFRLRGKGAISSAGTPVSVLTASGGVLDRTANAGGWFIAILHDVITGTVTQNTQISLTDFTTLIAAINSRGITVLPVGDVIRNYT